MKLGKGSINTGYRFLVVFGGGTEQLSWKTKLIWDAADVALGSRAFAFKNKVNYCNNTSAGGERMSCRLCRIRSSFNNGSVLNPSSLPKAS